MPLGNSKQSNMRDVALQHTVFTTIFPSQDFINDVKELEKNGSKKISGNLV